MSYDTIEFSAIDNQSSSDQDLPEPLDHWSLEDFEDLLASEDEVVNV